MPYDQATTLNVTINPLVLDECSLGASYPFNASISHPQFPAFAPWLAAAARSRRSGLCARSHSSRPATIPAGFSPVPGAAGQDHSGGTPTLPAGGFFHHNLWINGQRGETSFAVLNFSGQCYHLNPPPLDPERLRERTFVGRLSLDF